MNTVGVPNDRCLNVPKPSCTRSGEPLRKVLHTHTSAHSYLLRGPASSCTGGRGAGAAAAVAAAAVAAAGQHHAVPHQHPAVLIGVGGGTHVDHEQLPQQGIKRNGAMSKSQVGISREKREAQASRVNEVCALHRRRTVAIALDDR